ncbi:MAG: Gfo/Idh/MocA family oxidoreductase [Candidatus Omnitrophica bacterium]|nr:Gfo/Idh/MocA family oxidoreductase [Candidatus Omnitrophota bacterium]
MLKNEVKRPKDPNRREFMATSGKFVAVSALAGAVIPPVYAGEDNTIRIALVGCGGRGSGAVNNALSSQTGPTKLVAMADVYEDKMQKSYDALLEMFGERIDVPEERKFLGFDAYKKAIDCLRPGDVLVQATHSAFRAHHVEYAIQKGVNVFMEKSFAPDPVGTRKILQIGEEAKKKNLKIGCGLMCRHSSSRQALIDQIREGAVGQVELIRAYRMDRGLRLPPFKGDENEILWQIRWPYGTLWISSGKFVDWMIHQVDECCWIKDSWPVSAQGLGGVEPGSTDCSQNLHAYSIEYTFEDGTKAMVYGRGMKDCQTDFSTFLHGSKCGAQFSGNVHAPTTRIFKSQVAEDSNIAWEPEEETRNPYQVEWDELLTAIREDKPYNEVQRSAYTNMTALMGRAAVHTGQIVTWDQMMDSNFQFASSVDFTMESPSPVPANADGHYPIPVPGEWKEV